MQECFKRGLYWQGIIHDLSKYSLAEFVPSARYFQGGGTPILKMRAEIGYAPAWLHHKGRNKHHWDYWIDYHEGKMILCKIPEKYLIEMVCDMIGASKAYLSSEYTPSEPLKYFEERNHEWLILDEDKEFVKSLLVKNMEEGE